MRCSIRRCSRRRSRVPEYQQYITKKSENGQLFTLKSPGEIGSDCQLVRLYLYDVKAISKKDKRYWWKCAKLRSQFLTSTSLTDCKQQLLRRLLDYAANELKKILDVKRESRTFNYEVSTSSN